MAQEEWRVIFNRQRAGTQNAPQTEFTKAQCEAASNGRMTEKAIIKSVIEDAKIVTIEANSETEAAVAARVLLGAHEGEGELELAKKSNCGKKSAR